MTEETMQAAVLHGPRDLRVEPRPVPVPTGDDVVVEVSHCGVCGTDLHMVVEGWGTPGSVGGHEWSGRIVAVGDDVTDFGVGDFVVGGSVPGCGICDMCADGRPALCLRKGTPGVGVGRDGAFARFVGASQRQVVPVPTGLDLRTAALAEPLAVALHAVEQAAVSAGDRVLICGAGPIGALAIVALRDRGVTDIVVSEPGELRQRLARDLGASTVEPSALPTFSIVEPSALVDEAFDAVLECSGKRSAMEAGLCQLKRRGRLVLVGTGIEPPAFDPNRIILNEVTITGAYEYDRDGIAAALRLLDSGIDVSPLIADDVPLAGLGDAMVDLFEGRIAGKVLARPSMDIDPGGA